LGVPFNTIKDTTNEKLRLKRIEENKPGSSCPKKFLALSKEYSNKGICTASKKYQDLKLEELNAKKEDLSIEKFEKLKEIITGKACLCVGLANSSLIENNIQVKGEAQGVVICPGPNLAYFDKEVSLANMVQHIYGNSNVLSSENRPNMFIKELQMYLDYFRNQITESSNEITASQIKKLQTFKTNLIEGINYYQNLFLDTSFFENIKSNAQIKLQSITTELAAIKIPELG
jgi:hypothetical protein